MESSSMMPRRRFTITMPSPKEFRQNADTRAEAKAGDGNKSGRLAFYRRRLNVAKLP